MMIHGHIDKALRHIQEKFGSTEKYDIMIGEDLDDLYFLIGQRFRIITKPSKAVNHKRWVKKELANNRINGIIIDNVFIHYGIYDEDSKQ